MATAKMTDTILSTPDFIVTLTHQNRFKIGQEAPELILEVVPLVNAKSLERNLAEKFFNSITCPKERKKQSKKAIMNFTSTCTPHIQQEFLTNFHPEYLQAFNNEGQEMLIVLRNKNGDVLKSTTHSANDLCNLISQLEIGCTYHAPKKKTATFMTRQQTPHKKNKREWNRATRKYFLHHTVK